MLCSIVLCGVASRCRAVADMLQLQQPTLFIVFVVTCFGRQSRSFVALTAALRVAPKLCACACSATPKSIPHGSDKQQQKKQLSNSQSKRRTSDLEGVDEGDAAAADDGDAGDAGAGDAGDVEACRACSRVTRPREATGVVAAAALRDRVVVVGVEDVASGVVDEDEASSSSSSCSAALPELLVPLAASSSSSSSATDDSSACEGVSQTSSTTADSPAVLVLSLLFSSSTIELPSSVLGSSADTVASVAGVEELGVLTAMPLARRRTPPAAATELDSGLVIVDAGVSSSSPCCCSSSPGSGCCCCCCCE